MKFFVMLLLFCLLVNVVAADDTVYLEETVITGNQELPKVLYILPWREMETSLLPARELEYTTQSVLTPIYPQEHKRELDLRQTLRDARRDLSAETNRSE